MMARRRWILWTALCATLAATLWAIEDDGPVHPKKMRSVAAGTGSGPKGSMANRKEGLPTVAELAGILEATRPAFAEDGLDLFALRNWQPLPPPPAIEPPTRPVPPPLPFRFIGKAEEDNKVVAFVENDTESFLLREGEIVGQYRVSKVTADGATFVYLPLNEPQLLRY